eukprot:GHVS01039863.1.p1 GENE.GHVS01039863.1~~GHVS01039863.1.p1  ORF type:complete len:819 (+),score=134.39 GHVS01039863.1:1328-3784(+)
MRRHAEQGTRRLQMVFSDPASRPSTDDLLDMHFFVCGILNPLCSLPVARRPCLGCSAAGRLTPRGDVLLFPHMHQLYCLSCAHAAAQTGSYQWGDKIYSAEDVVELSTELPDSSSFLDSESASHSCDAGLPTATFPIYLHQYPPPPHTQPHLATSPPPLVSADGERDTTTSRTHTPTSQLGQDHHRYEDIASVVKDEGHPRLSTSFCPEGLHKLSSHNPPSPILPSLRILTNPTKPPPHFPPPSVPQTPTSHNASSLLESAKNRQPINGRPSINSTALKSYQPERRVHSQQGQCFHDAPSFILASSSPPRGSPSSVPLSPPSSPSPLLSARQGTRETAPMRSSSSDDVVCEEVLMRLLMQYQTNCSRKRSPARSCQQQIDLGEEQEAAARDIEAVIQEARLADRTDTAYQRKSKNIRRMLTKTAAANRCSRESGRWVSSEAAARLALRLDSSKANDPNWESIATTLYFRGRAMAAFDLHRYAQPKERRQSTVRTEGGGAADSEDCGQLPRKYYGKDGSHLQGFMGVLYGCMQLLARPQKRDVRLSADPPHCFSPSVESFPHPFEAMSLKSSVEDGWTTRREAIGPIEEDGDEEDSLAMVASNLMLNHLSQNIEFVSVSQLVRSANAKKDVTHTAAPPQTCMRPGDQVKREEATGTTPNVVDASPEQFTHGRQTIKEEEEVGWEEEPPQHPQEGKPSQDRNHKDSEDCGVAVSRAMAVDEMKEIVEIFQRDRRVDKSPKPVETNEDGGAQQTSGEFVKFCWYMRMMSEGKKDTWSLCGLAEAHNILAHRLINTDSSDTAASAAKILFLEASQKNDDSQG